MQVVYGVHRVPLVGEAARLGGRVDLGGQAEPLDQDRVRLLAIVYDRRSGHDVAEEGLPDRQPGGLSPPGREGNACLPVGRRDDAYEVPRQPLGLLPVRLGLPLLGVGPHVGLVDVDAPGKHHLLLGSIKDGKRLPEPEISGFPVVLVVPRRRPEGMELEQVEEELYPLGDRYLPRVEDGPRQGAEAPSARLA